MKRPGARGLVGATLAVGAFAAALSVAQPLFDAPVPRVVLDSSSKENGSSKENSSNEKRVRGGWLSRIEARLAQRVPSLAEPQRIRLADTIVEEALAASLDPLFVLALIEVESGYHPGALSERGARGLMQLRPSTLRREATRWRLPGSDPSDPVVNIQAGVRYYRRLLTAFRNHEELALMAYNAGPQRISGYLKSGEVPERFRTYPRRVRAEFRRLRRALASDEGTVLAARDAALVQPAAALEPARSATRAE